MAQPKYKEIEKLIKDLESGKYGDDDFQNDNNDNNDIPEVKVVLHGSSGAKILYCEPLKDVNTDEDFYDE